MADAIYEEMAAVYEGMSGGEEAIKKYFKAVSAGIIKHMESNMDVLSGSGEEE
ncbi:MAG: hypothetical protein LBG57_09155 [Treponema sp.]|nr:hypothetical protein [Treponema sp.]